MLLAWLYSELHKQAEALVYFCHEAIEGNVSVSTVSSTAHEANGYPAEQSGYQTVPFAFRELDFPTRLTACTTI